MLIELFTNNEEKMKKNNSRGRCIRNCHLSNTQAAQRYVLTERRKFLEGVFGCQVEKAYQSVFVSMTSDH